MKIRDWYPPDGQMCKLGKNSWSVSRLHELSKGLPVMDAPIDFISVYLTYENLTLRDMVMHMKAVNDADLSFPIILDEDGELMDGRHRLMKAMLEGYDTIKVVRFDENPSPCQISE